MNAKLPPQFIKQKLRRVFEIKYKKYFYHEQHRKDTALSNEYRRLKELNASLEIEFSILKKCPPTRRKRACYLFIRKAFHN